MDVVYGLQSVDAADEFDVARAPGRVWPHRLHILHNRQACGGIVPGQRKMNDTRRQDQIVEIRNLFFAFLEGLQQAFAAEDAPVIMNLQGSHSSSDVQYSRQDTRA